MLAELIVIAAAFGSAPAPPTVQPVLPEVEWVTISTEPPTRPGMRLVCDAPTVDAGGTEFAACRFVAVMGETMGDEPVRRVAQAG